MAGRVNPNLRFLHAELKHEKRNELLQLYESGRISFEEYKEQCLLHDVKTGVLLEGSSRSFKNISSLDFIIMLCSRVETGSVINIMRDTYVSFKTTIYNDADWRFPQFGLRSPFKGKQEVKSFTLFGNKITMIGADSEAAQLGVGCDYLYMNEMLSIAKDVRNQAIQRCRKFWWGDYNPMFSEHDVYILATRPDVGHLKTTYRDNFQITPPERIQIESYQPVEMSKIAQFWGAKEEDQQIKYKAIQRALKYDCDKNIDKFPLEDIAELKRCRTNENAGTADKYKWMVYGLGERMAPEGVIFPNVTWIKEFPKDCPNIYWGQDFGYTVDPSTLVKVGIDRIAEPGSHVKPNMYLQCMFYQPTPTANDFINLLALHANQDITIWADPSGDYGGRGYISEARRAGYNVYAITPFPGSIEYGLSIMKKYNLHLVDCPEFRKEQPGYVKAKAKVNGVMVVTDTPIDKDNHAIGDAPRMACIANRL